MPANLVIRADAGPQIGTGHVMRCLALAGPWLQSGSEVTLVSEKLPAALAGRIKIAGIKLLPMPVLPGGKADAQALAQIAENQKADWVVIDGYHFDADYQGELKKAGLRVLFFDDFGHAQHYCADFVLNQNLGASETLYKKREPETQLLLGTRFVQLRDEFLKWRDWRRTIPPQAKKILVTLGGSDSENVTLKVIQAIQQITDLKFEATVVIGGSNPHEEMLKSTAKDSPSIRLLQNASNMPELMAEADLAVAAGGSTAWELTFMGLPALTLVLAENQRGVATSLHQSGVSVNLGEAAATDARQIAGALSQLLTDRSRRKTMSDLGCKLVDGLGACRIAAILRGEKKIHD